MYADLSKLVLTVEKDRFTSVGKLAILLVVVWHWDGNFGARRVDLRRANPAQT